MKKLYVLLIGSALAGCSQGYSDLEKAFGTDKVSGAQALATRSFVISSVHHRGATSIRDLATIRLSDEAIEIEVSMPFMGSLRIPTAEIAACGMTCFGTDDQRVDLLVPKTGSDIMIPRTEKLLEWCWRNQKPMIPSSMRRDWQYKDISLPSPETFKEQLTSRANFDHQTRMSCLGY